MARAAADAVAQDRLELLIERRAESIALLSPGIGLFTGARRTGDLLSGGADAGVLLVLGRGTRLAVPPGVEGRVVTAPATLVRQPVSWGDPLYEIRPIVATTEGSVGAGSPAAGDGPAAAGASTALLFRSPHSGRFYLRPSPAEEAFITAGAMIEDGQTIGLIEVMKTFAHVRYDAAGGLPERARVVRILVADGADIGTGDPLLELELPTL